VQDFQGGSFRIGWDAGNGAAGPALEKLVQKLPGEHFTIFTDVDGSFPNHHPDPTVEKNLAHLKELVLANRLDFGIAFDGDGDRIGAVDGRGRVIWGDQLMMLFAGPVLNENPGATIIADVKASQTLFDRIADLGGQPLMWKTGHSLIKSKMKETGAPLAGEMSGHIFFMHRWYGFDDALYAAVRLIEAVARSGESLTTLVDQMPQTVATPEMRFPVDAPRKFAIVQEVLARLIASGVRVDSTDGARVMTSDGWWLLRASNTQDVLVARAESKDEAGLVRLVAEIDQQLALSGAARSDADH
jgi:phosphomannomutase